MRLGNTAKITLYLVRHGRTLANEAHLYCGKTDLPLSEGGRQALFALPRPRVVAQHFYHSGLLRASQTLALLFSPTQWGVLPNLQELDFGVFEGKSYEQLKNDPAYGYWITNQDTAAPPKGECKADFTRRIVSGLQQAAADLHDGEAAVVLTHGGVIASLLGLFLPGEKNFYQWQPACGKGYALVFEDGFIIEYYEI